MFLAYHGRTKSRKPCLLFQEPRVPSIVGFKPWDIANRCLLHSVINAVVLTGPWYTENSDIVTPADFSRISTDIDY